MASTVYKNNIKPSIKAIFKLAADALRHFKSINKNDLYDGDIGLIIKLEEKSRGDTDNYAKAIADALQGVAFRDDKQVSCIVCYRDSINGRRLLKRLIKELLCYLKNNLKNLKKIKIV